MGFNEVFVSLREIFPQVDIRILKAVAIEHPNDVDAAAESVLTDVLPSIIGSSKASSTLEDTSGTEQPATLSGSLSLDSAVGKGKKPILFEHQEEEEEEFTSQLSGTEPVACENTVSNHCSSSAYLMPSCIGETNHGGLQVGPVNSSEVLECLTSHDNAKELNSDADLGPKLTEKEIHLNRDAEDLVPRKALAQEEFVSVIDNTNATTVALGSLKFAAHGCTLEQPIEKSESVGDIFHDSVQTLLELDPSVSASLRSDNQNASLETLEINSNSLENREIMKGGNYDVHDLNEEFGNLVMPSNAQHLSELGINDNVLAAVTVNGEAVDACRCEVEFIATSSKIENSHSESVKEGRSDLLSYESGMLSTDEDTLPSALLTHSGHFVSIEYLEDLVSDAKRNKTNLLSAVELTTNLMREAELLEEGCTQAKEAACSAGQDILSQTEELKKILVHAKEANDMHAGEVYGEKAILATEARELQSRLTSLSDERDKYLSVIEEIRQTLDARLAATKEEIATAEKEKLEKEAQARMALSEQEAIMASVVEESKKLKEAAEANSKLREFLMDRGHIVDTLQGEIAIICEDVMMLKEIVDGRVQLGRSGLKVSSFSSSSSLNVRTKDSSDGILEHEDVITKTAFAEQEQHQLQQPEKYDQSSDTNGTSTDDGWELLKDGVLCA